MVNDTGKTNSAKTNKNKRKRQHEKCSGTAQAVLSIEEYTSPFYVMYADLCDSTQLKAEAYGHTNAMKATKMVLLHNTIIKENINIGKNAKGRGILKELGDAVIAYFDDAMDAIKTACQIQRSFNIYNLLFSAHQLHTKISIAAHEDPYELFHTLSNAKDHNFEPVNVKDFIGTAMDAVARIQELTHQDEIIISGRIQELLSKHADIIGIHDKLFAKLEDKDADRFKSLRSIGKVDLFLVNWGTYPCNVQWSPRAFKASTPETIAVLQFEEVRDKLGTIEQLLQRLSKSRICLLPNLLNTIHSAFDSKDFCDLMLIGHSLSSWIRAFSDHSTRKSLIEKQVKIEALLFDMENISLLNSIFLPEDVSKIEQEIEASMEDIPHIRKHCPAVRFKKTSHLLDAWSFSSIDPVTLMKAQHHNFISDWKLPWETIGDALFDDEKIRMAFRSLIDEANKKYPTIEISIHDVVFAPGDAISFITAMDWAFACTYDCEPSPTREIKSQYIRMRKHFEYVLNKAEDI